MLDPTHRPEASAATAPWRKLFWAGLLFLWLGIGLVLTWNNRIFAHWDENYADEFGPQLRLHPPTRMLAPPAHFPSPEGTPALPPAPVGSP